MSASTLQSTWEMLTTSASTRQSDNGETKASNNNLRQIERELDELEALIAAVAPPEQFVERMLESACDRLGAHAAAIWLGSECLAERSQPDQPWGQSCGTGAKQDRARSVLDVIRSHKAVTLPSNQQDSAAALRSLAMVAPFAIDDDAEGAVELHFPMPALPMPEDRLLRAAEAYAELAGDYYRRQCLRRLRHRESAWRSLEQFDRRIHRPTLNETAIAIVNDVPGLIRCDRVSLLDCRARKFALLAVTGVDQIDRRTSEVIRLQRLAATIATSNEPLWPIDAHVLPEVESARAEYLEAANTRAIAAFPLFGEPRARQAEETSEASRDVVASGVLVFEWYTTPSPTSLDQEQIRRTVDHIEVAFRNARHAERLPLIGLSRFLAKLGWLMRARRRPVVVCAVVVIFAVAALCLIPAEWRVSAEGRLLPVQRREIFAPADAVVDAVLVDQGDDVHHGQPLLRLRSAPLEFEKARLDGEIQTAQKRLTALQTARLQPVDRVDAAKRQMQLTADEEEVKLQLASLMEQRKLLDEQLEQLDVGAPEAGQVLTWDAKHSLAGCPVRRGQPLLSIGNVTGRWEAELRVPDDRMHGVLETVERANRENRPVAVELMVAGEPETTYRGEIDRIALRTEVDDELRQPVVLVTVRLLDMLPDPRPGSVILARICCGRRSVGKVWFGDTWNTIRRRLLF
jgi:hypothetical protein